MKTREEIDSTVQAALGINIDTLAEQAGGTDNEHNLREAWGATVDRIAEFQSRYVEKSTEASS